MDAHNKKAAEAHAPTAQNTTICVHDFALSSATPQAVLTFNGTALRHLRRAQTIALRHAACSRVGRELLTAREAVDLALWACDYAEAK